MSDRDERDFWDRRAAAWERRADSLSEFSDGYGIPAMDALRVERGEVVLDLGCGPGTTAIELAARVVPDGRVVGVDISPAMVAAATRRAASAGVGNARFVAVDAQTGDLGEHFDAAYSRFGVMFFADPTAALANIYRALRPEGRFACVVWGPLTDNPCVHPDARCCPGARGGSDDSGSERAGAVLSRRGGTSRIASP